VPRTHAAGRGAEEKVTSYTAKSRGSAISITITAMDNRWFGHRVPVMSVIFISPYHPDLFVSTQSPN
jgi:hypothetical protein